MKITATLLYLHSSNESEGVSKNTGNTWKKCTMTFTSGEDTLPMNTFKWDKPEPRTEVEVDFEITGREWQGKYFPELKLIDWRNIEPIPNVVRKPEPVHDNKFTSPEPPSDDLPF